MLFLVAYMIINIIISIMLEKSKRQLHFAAALHAISFTVVFIIMLFVQGNAMNGILSRIFDEPTSQLTAEIMTSGTDIFSSPVTVIEMIMPIIIAAVCVILAVKTVKYVREKLSKYPYMRKQRGYEKVFLREDTEIINKLYRINCVMLC